MQLLYDEDFIEAAVLLCVSGRRKGVPSLQIARFHREREKLYTILDPDERNEAFFRLHLEWFREWGIEKLLTEAIAEFPRLAKDLVSLGVRRIPNRNDEGAELYVNEVGQRNGLLALCSERLIRDKALTNYLRHEFMHLSDMLDPAFGYMPELDLPGLNPAQMRIARERYRVLWDITIDGRLAAAHHTPMATREQHAAAFARAYSFWPEEKQSGAFAGLWENPAPSHALLLALIADPRGLRHEHRPVPGASCPLCGFPTFAWASTEALAPDLTDHIRAEFPSWSVQQGLCGRCLESYQVAAKLRQVSLSLPILPG